MESGEPGNGKLQVRGSLPGKVTKDGERTLGCLGEEPQVSRGGATGIWGRSQGIAHGKALGWRCA